MYKHAVGSLQKIIPIGHIYDLLGLCGLSLHKKNEKYINKNSNLASNGIYK